MNASVSKRAYLVLCLSSTARTEERAGGDMRFSQTHLVTFVFIQCFVMFIDEMLFVTQFSPKTLYKTVWLKCFTFQKFTIKTRERKKKE